MKGTVLYITMQICSVLVFGQNEKKPFPQHVPYFSGTTKPNQVSQRQLDASVTAFYDAWKSWFIRQGCDKNQNYVWFDGRVGSKQCVSEGQGYGMIIVALMAGYDNNAKTTFDGLYAYYKAHPSKRCKYLMAWGQQRNCKDADGSSATDGDMDIAYALLLANKQWGSGGAINYLAGAKQMINAIMQQEINHQTFSVMLSNAVEHDSKDYFDMRSSDFMPAHFKCFDKVMPQRNWNTVVDNNYQLFKLMQTQFSPEAGIVPDFIVHIDKKAQPTRGVYLESRYDGFYNYNACRVPWRVAYRLFAKRRCTLKSVCGEN